MGRPQNPNSLKPTTRKNHNFRYWYLISLERVKVPFMCYSSLNAAKLKERERALIVISVMRLFFTTSKH